MPVHKIGTVITIPYAVKSALIHFKCNIAYIDYFSINLDKIISTKNNEMGWLDSKHRASEEAAERLQAEEHVKVREQRISNGKYINFNREKDFDFDNVYEFEILKISNETRHTDYYTDTYKIAKPSIIKGYPYRLTYISEALSIKYKIRHYDGIVRDPLSPSFEKQLLQNLSFEHDFYEISSISDSWIHISLRNFYKNDGTLDKSKLWSIFYGYYRNNDEKYKSQVDVENAFKKIEADSNHYKNKYYRFDSFAEKDNGEIREVYYMIPIKANE